MLVEVRVFESSLPKEKGRFRKAINYMEENGISYCIDRTYTPGRVIKVKMTFKQIKKMYKEIPELGAMVF